MTYIENAPSELEFNQPKLFNVRRGIFFCIEKYFLITFSHHCCVSSPFVPCFFFYQIYHWQRHSFVSIQMFCNKKQGITVHCLTTNPASRPVNRWIKVAIMFTVRRCKNVINKGISVIPDMGSNCLYYIFTSPQSPPMSWNMILLWLWF